MDPRKKSLRLFRGKGCKICGFTGYHGRIGIFEVLVVTEKIRKLIMKLSDSDTIKKEACDEGMTTMIEDGLAKAVQSHTTLEEILRVTREENG